MVEFTSWFEAFIFGAIYSTIVIVPCIITALLGRKMIDQLGTYPSRTPVIQLSIFSWFVVTEIVTFFLLLAFYSFFASS